MNDKAIAVVAASCLIPILITLALSQVAAYPALKFIPAGTMGLLAAWFFIKAKTSRSYRGFAGIGLAIFGLIALASFIATAIVAGLLCLAR